jgi:hypothetical protein
MKIARFRHSAEAAVAVLLISGAGIAFAGNSSTAAPVAAAPAVAPAVAPVSEPVEPVGVDTDTLQQGDQTTPDVAPAAAKVAPLNAKTLAAPAAPAASPETTTPETGTESTTPETVEAGEPALAGGGHADNPADANADHQFDGIE